VNALVLAWRLFGAILWVPASVIFNLLYVLLCPYFLCDNVWEEDYYNYINHFDMFL
jgi:hypothetical protein